MKQLQQLHELLKKQLALYKQGMWEEGHSYFRKINDCLEKQNTAPSPLKKHPKIHIEEWEKLKKDCYQYTQEIHFYLENGKQKIKKEHLVALLELGMLQLEKEEIKP